MIVSEQLNYIKTRRFHAIFMPVIIEFSRCIGTYSSAKFESYNKSGRKRNKIMKGFIYFPTMKRAWPFSPVTLFSAYL